MQSKLAAAIKLASQPVALIRSSTCPPDAISFSEGSHGCVISLLVAASNGKTAVLSEKTTGCPGGKVGLGFAPFRPGIEHFLSTGSDARPGEHYKKSPELACVYTQTVPKISAKEYLIFQPLSALTADQHPDAIVFLVNADQLSGLATLANYDKLTQDNVKLLFGAGCAQSILFPLYSQEHGEDFCYIGLTDPSARKCVPSDQLSFAIPYSRFLTMEAEASDSFLHTDTWKLLYNRIK